MSQFPRNLSMAAWLGAASQVCVGTSIYSRVYVGTSLLRLTRPYLHHLTVKLLAIMGMMKEKLASWIYMKRSVFLSFLAHMNTRTQSLFFSHSTKPSKWMIFRLKGYLKIVSLFLGIVTHQVLFTEELWRLCERSLILRNSRKAFKLILHFFFLNLRGIWLSQLYRKVLLKNRII